MSDSQFWPAVKTDPRLPKAEPVSDTGGTSVITHLKRVKKTPHSSCERGMRKM